MIYYGIIVYHISCWESFFFLSLLVYLEALFSEQLNRE